MADELHYVPMPANVVKDIQNMWASDIKDASGKPIFVRDRTDECANGKRRSANRRPFSNRSVLKFGRRAGGLHCDLDGRLSCAPESWSRPGACDSAFGETSRG